MCRETSGRGGKGQEKAHKGRKNIAGCAVKLVGGKAMGKKKRTRQEKYCQMCRETSGWEGNGQEKAHKGRKILPGGLMAYQASPQNSFNWSSCVDRKHEKEKVSTTLSLS